MPITTAEQALAKVGKLYEQLTARRSDIDKLNKYYLGEQPLAYASKEWSEFHRDRFGKFSDNWCGVVANSPAERLRVTGFRIGEDAEVITDQEKQLARDWDTNDLDAQSSQGFLQSIIAKRSAVLVWGDDDDEPVITWEHPSQVIVEYDPQNQRRQLCALKAWTEDELELATLYTPTEVWKFERQRVAGNIVEGRTQSGLFVAGSPSVSSAGWDQRLPDSDDTWPIDNPLGVVPFVEFLNRPMLGGEPLSDIAGTVSMQNAINLLWAYLFGAADYASMPARVIMGQEPPKIPVLDANGQKIGEKAVDIDHLKRGRLLWLTGQHTKIAQFEPAKLDVFTEVINRGVRHLAAQTRTPVHYIVGELNNVNGETLLAGETGLVKKVDETQLFFGPAVRGIKSRSALVRGDKALAQECMTGTVQWADAETRTPAQAADAALKERQIGFPLAWIAERRFGLTQPEVARLMAMVEAEANDPMMARLMRGLEGGGAPDAAA